MDNFVSLVFVVVSVLFTGLGIIATKGTAETSIFSSPIWVAAIALYFALRAYHRLLVPQTNRVQSASPSDVSVPTSVPRHVPQLSSSAFQIGFGVALAIAVIVFHLVRVNVSWNELNAAKKAANEAQKEMVNFKTRYDKQLQSVTSEYDRRIAETQAQIRELETRSSKK